MLRYYVTGTTNLHVLSPSVIRSTGVILEVCESGAYPRILSHYGTTNGGYQISLGSAIYPRIFCIGVQYILGYFVWGTIFWGVQNIL